MIFFLIGFMGCGKSTVGRKVAEVSGFLFADTDRMVEEEAGKSIRQIFEEHGEEAFRQIEDRILSRLCRKYADSEADLIVATGGGMPCRDKNIALMKRRGVVIYLDASSDTLFSRLISAQRERPRIAALNESELRAFIEASLAERMPYYLQAPVRIGCDGRSVEDIIYHLLHYVNRIYRG